MDINSSVIRDLTTLCRPSREFRESLGFLPNDVAQRLAPELDAGEVITARVVRVTQADVPEITLELAL
jgi:exosome complex RNA-binding protein Rrp4